MLENAYKRQPEVRFKGFDSDWEEKTLGAIGHVAMNRRVFKHQTSAVGEIPFFKIGSFGSIPDSFISRKLFEDYKRRYPYPSEGSLLISASGSIGKIVEYEGRDEYFQDSNIVWLEHDNNIVNLFLKQFYLFVQWSGLEGSTIKRLYNKNILDTKITVPDYDEQTQIGLYFKSLDRMIELHQRKHDKLVILKQAMLQKMFPQDGATTPEIRFKGFIGGWESKPLGEVASITSASRVHKNEWTKSGVPFLRSSDVVAKYNGKTNEKAFISFDLYRSLTEKSGRLKKGDILITGGGSIGIPYQVESDDPLYSKDADLLWLKIGQEVDSDFLYIFLTSGMFRRYLKSISHIGTIAHYTVVQANSTPIAVPTLEEQLRIGAYFHNLDKLVTKHATQLKKLKNIKSACLDKMFV